MVTLMLNPFIYSLRNTDIKSAPKSLFEIKTIKGTAVLRMIHFLLMYMEQYCIVIIYRLFYTTLGTRNDLKSIGVQV
jgi:hypothetical protein